MIRHLTDHLLDAIDLLRSVAPAQWCARLGALACQLAAAVLVACEATSSFAAPLTMGLILPFIALAVLNLLQLAQPGSEAGLLTFAAWLFALWASPPLSIAASIGLAASLLASHSLWAIAARSPAHAHASGRAVRRVLGTLALVFGLATALVVFALVPLLFMPQGAIPSVIILVAILVVFGALAWLLLPHKDEEESQSPVSGKR
ncbi:hypothetical protein [Dermabacter vaginalis]|uniref:hypothetical protein n=1 Tax=Dermabacter vaginalis TaxID=1630135 RepID=UPI001EF575A7|nr:hypothetical protein [Dermabacter vaginalis]MCG7442876.1 hypothetical protein [Dermabacter vaginalis]